MARFCIVQECAVHNDIGPYIYLLAKDAHVEIESIYRGDDARKLLNKYGKHSQYQLYHATPSQRQAWGVLGTPDMPGRSTHELRSDGRAFPGPIGRKLAWWQQGFDVNGSAQADKLIATARKHGWTLFRPYPSGAELHHLCFRSEPHLTKLRTKLRVYRLRHTLPRS